MTQDWLDGLRAHLDVEPKVHKPLDESGKIHKLVLEEGDRRNITVLFLDIKGFTSMSEKLDPEKVKFVIDSTFQALTRDIHKFDGFVDKYIGDAIMALFGGKQFDEHSAERAVRSGFVMLETMKKVNSILSGQEIELSARIGINTGLVVTGTVGGAREGDWTVMGDAVNLAQRLESNAKENTILVSEDTKKRIGDFIRFEKQPPLKVKGKTHPIQTFQSVEIIDVTSHQSIIELKDENLLVGKSEHFESLKKMVFGASENSIHTAQCVTIESEAGLGKSRFIQTFINSEFQNSWKKHVLYCEYPMFSVEPFPVYQIWLRTFLKDATKINYLPKALEFWISEISESKLKKTLIAQQDIFDYLLQIRGADEKIKDYSAQQLVDEVQISMRVFLQSVYKRNPEFPLICVVDDFHLATDQFYKQIIALFQSLDGEIPLILLATERPGEKEISLESTIRESGIPHEKIILQPFSQDECKNFLSILLDSSVMIDGATLRILFQKSEGNPLFLSEIVYTLIENEFVEKHEDYFYFSPKLAGFDIPENIHGLLLKKIDKFPQDVKHAIQFASIIGFQFPQSIWENMYESTPHISFFGDVLAQLKSERFLVVDDATRQIKFTNAAVRGATESTVLRRNKKKIHRIAAELGAGIFEKDSRKWVSFLSFHYYGAEMFDEAIPVTIQALEFRAREYNFEIGHSLYLHCMEALEKTESQDWDSYMKLYELAFQLFDLTGMYDDMNNLLGRMETIAGRSGNIEHKLKSDYHHCFYFSRKGDFEKSNEFGYRAIENLKKLNNPEMEANILNLIGANHMLSHEYSKAIKYFKMSAGVKVKRIVVKSLGNIAIVKRLQGKYYDAIDNLQKGLVLSQEIGDQRSIFSKIHKLGHVYFLTSKFDEAIERNLDALEIAENLGDALAISSVKGNIARLFIATKNFKDARKTLIETLQIAKRINNSTHIATCYSNLGTVDKAEGFFDKAIENLKKSIEIAEQTENKRAVAMRKYEIGKLYLIVGNLSKAKIEITESIRIYKMLRLDYRYFSEVALAELHFYIAEHEKSLKILEIATQKLFDVEGFRDEYFEAVCLKMENFNAMSKYKKSVKTLEANKQLVEDANKENAGVLFIFLNYLEAKISLKSVVDEKYIDLLESAILQEENPKYPVFLWRLSKIYHHLGEELKSKTALIKSERILMDQSERIEEINLRENFLRSPLFRGFLNN